MSEIYVSKRTWLRLEKYRNKLQKEKQVPLTMENILVILLDEIKILEKK